MGSGSDPTAKYSQSQRLLKIKTNLADDDLMLERFSGDETLSKPYAFQLTLVSANKSIDMKSLLRTPATVTVIQADGTDRYFNGVFSTFTQAAQDAANTVKTEKTGISNPDEEFAVYNATLVPKFTFLKLDADCKISQNMTVPAIVEKVLKDKGITDYSFRLNGTYPSRDYCVQYRESSHDYISRLLEEEGIFYFFEHTDTKHTMVFADKSSVLPSCPGQATATYSSARGGWVGKGEEGVASIERKESTFTGKAAVTDYNFETPSLSLMSNLADDNEEAYDYPGEFSTKSDGQRYVQLRLEEREAQQFQANGTSKCRAFRPGTNFKLKGHFRKDTNGDYFITSVTHNASDTTARQNQEKAHSYGNSFQSMPKTVPFRPERKTPRPKVQGLQSAVVCGKSGEEIWCDKYGRVKVQFFWDRVGQKNEDSSCWVRVSQVWAGKNWGWMTVPRVGQEVLVDFLEGDPDKPIIVGRVYNAEQMPPWDLPANQTQSGILTRSSKGGSSDTFNRIQFEDLSGSEAINIWAQKDMNTHVENNDDQKVEQNRTIEVDGTHTEKIVGDTTITITQGKHSTTVQQGDQSNTVSMGNHSNTVSMGNQSNTVSMGNITVDCSMGSISVTAMQSITLTVGGSSVTIDQSGVTIQGIMITVTGNAITQVSGSGMLQLTGGITMINS
jgi:type VI secretion system secreted protein VgrG